MKKTLIFFALCFTNIVQACTAFGVITNTGTLIGKNRDYYYGPQTINVTPPSSKLLNWHQNTYHHANHFFGLTASDGVAMGVNEHGLTAIEEDTIRPLDASTHRRFLEPVDGTLDGMVLYGVLQNFNTVDEMLPYLSSIFSVAAPDFYQFADAHKILTVEVAFASQDNDPKRQFHYRVMTKNGKQFEHTNIYVTPQYEFMNDIPSKASNTAGAQNRLITIKTLMAQTKNINIRGYAVD